MKVLKVSGEGTFTSFRYPFFMQGVQPTFEMPPPATLYGHVASALGEWFDPVGALFGVHFTFARQAEDIEHTHILVPSTGKLPGSDLRKSMEGSANPFRRGVLFQPRLTLYLNHPEWAMFFKSPRYAVVLGRSQDLFTYTREDEVELERSDHGYVEHTLAPHTLGRWAGRGIVVLMPRFLDYHHSRRPTFEKYLVFHARIHSRDFLQYTGEEPLGFWVDPTSTEIDGDHLIVPMHSWVGTSGEAAL